MIFSLESLFFMTEKVFFNSLIDFYVFIGSYKQSAEIFTRASWQTSYLA